MPETLPGEIPPPEDPVLRELYEATGIVSGREFALLRDGKHAPGARGKVIRYDPATGFVHYSVTENKARTLSREIAIDFSENRVAWWIN